MSAAGSHLALAPERCDRCGRCVPACARGALRVGGGFIYVDASTCDNCFSCVDVCHRQAITRRPVGRLGVISTGSGAARVVVGSRSEAKAIRQQAVDAERTVARRASAAVRDERLHNEAARVDAADASEGRVIWTLSDAGVALFVMSVSLVATRMLSASGAVSVMPPTGQIAVRVGLLIGFFAAQIATLSVLARRHGTRLIPAFGLGRLGRGARTVTATVSLVVALTVLTRLVSYGWGAFARAVGWSPPDSGALTVVFGGGGVGLALALVALAILGPVAEELAFRGVLLRALGRSWGKWPAILATAVIFAGYHVTAWTLVPLLALGIALGWLAWSRRSLWAAILLHALYNGVVVAAAYWLAQ